MCVKKIAAICLPIKCSASALCRYPLQIFYMFKLKYFICSTSYIDYNFNCNYDQLLETTTIGTTAKVYIILNF